MKRYIVIGAGVAGVSAIEAIRSRDTSTEILLLTNESFGYYSRPGLAYYLTGEISERQLFPFEGDDFKRLNVRLLHSRVVRIHPQAHQVELENGARLTYQGLLIATGAQASRVSVPGVELRGVVKLDNLLDARWILKLVRKTRSGVVVGGGITALEVVEGLRARGVKTHYFLRRDRYWSNVLDETESRIVEHRLEEEGVQIHYHTELAEILGKRGRVVAVRTEDGREIKCQMVAIAVGIRPRKDLAESCGLETDRGILVNEYLRTSDPDIYAAGDVAQVYDPFSGKFVLDSLWGPARDQGWSAGLNMTGDRVPYIKSIPFNVTRLAGLTTTIIGKVGGRASDEDLFGIARGDSETWRELPDAIAAQSDFDVNRLRILVGEKHLLGAIVMGDQTLSQPVHHLVAHQVDITSVRSALLRPNAPIAELIADFYTSWRASNATQQS